MGSISTIYTNKVIERGDNMILKKIVIEPTCVKCDSEVREIKKTKIIKPDCIKTVYEVECTECGFIYQIITYRNLKGVI